MSAATVPPLALGERESVHGIAALIREWISLGTQGVVWVRYESDVSRDLMLSLVASEIPRIAFRPPEPLLAPEWLEKTLAALPGKPEAPGVMALLFPPPQSGANVETQPIWESFRMLNLRRESIVAFPLVQIWCAPAAIAARAQLEAPDLASWFLLKFRLDELPPPGGWTDSLIPTELSADGLRDFAQGLPRESLALRELKVELGRKRLAAASNDAERAGILNNLSVNFTALRNSPEALKAATDAVALYRKLDAASANAFSPYLAMSLSNLATAQSDAGRFDEAVVTAEEAVKIYRHLAGTNPSTFLPELAMALNNFANRQGEIGRRAEALRLTEEAVGLYRQLAKANSLAFIPYVAMSLNNLGIHQGELGKRDEAFGTAQEAANLYRNLANKSPDAFTPHLAGSLSNLGFSQLDAGRPDEAFATAQEAVELYRMLVKTHPSVFRPDLAMSLSVLGDCQTQLKQPEAIKSYRESIALLTSVFLALPKAHNKLMGNTIRAYLGACEKAAQPPDQALLAPIQEVLNGSPR